MSDEKRYVRKDVTGATVEGDLILFDPVSGKYFATGEVGADIWSRLATPLTLDELCRHMARDYDVAPEVCRKDVVEFVERLRASGLVGEADAA
jgi:hypothetical protein